jgi:hypothetical protein
MSHSSIDKKLLLHRIKDGGNSMKKICGIITILVILASCTTIPEEQPENISQEETVFSDTGVVSFQNNEYLVMCILVDDLQKANEIWGVPDSQGYPKLSSVTRIKRDEPLSLFLIYATRKSEINMTYDLRTLRPEGTFSVNAAQGLVIARGNSPDDLMYSARQMLSWVGDETDSYGTYQFHISVFDNNELIVNLIMEFNLVE